jgi:hypothetical protein
MASVYDLTAAAKSPAWYQRYFKFRTHLEERIALFPGGITLDGINVGLLVCFQLCLFSLSQLSEDVGGSVLCQGFMEIFDGLLEITEFLVSGSYSAECPICQLGTVEAVVAYLAMTL